MPLNLPQTTAVRKTTSIKSSLHYTAIYLKLSISLLHLTCSFSPSNRCTNTIPQCFECKLENCGECKFLSYLNFNLLWRSVLLPFICIPRRQCARYHLKNVNLYTHPIQISLSIHSMHKYMEKISTQIERWCRFEWRAKQISWLR